MCMLCAALNGGDNSTGQAESLYRYTVKDFQHFTVKPLHLDLTLDIAPKDIQVTTLATYLYPRCQDRPETFQPLKVIKLDQNDLSVQSVEVIVQNADNSIFKPALPDLRTNDWIAHVNQFERTAATVIEEAEMNSNAIKFVKITDFLVDQEDQKLIINLPEGLEILPDSQFILKTLTTCVPNAHELEGFYHDYTPENCPQTFITQCQQFGFRRIAPTIDQMTSKCSYTTTIIADGRYTNILSNGDFAWSKTNPRTSLIEPVFHIPSSHFPQYAGADAQRGEYQARRVCRYLNYNTMPTYLFFCGVGTYTTYARDVELPLHKDDPINLERVQKGDEPLQFYKFRIDLVSFPDAFKPTNCVESLEILHNALNWLSIMGPSPGYNNPEYGPTCRKILALIKKREMIKDSIGQGRYNIYASLKQISEDTEPSQLTQAVAGIAPVNLLVQKMRATANTPETMEAPVSKYDVDAFPIWCGVNKVVAEKELKEIRAELAALTSTAKVSDLFFKYREQIYREIGMLRSNYGGMENVGNTTILSSRLVPQPLLTDAAFTYMYGVKIHEAVHHVNGSLTTGKSPFEIFLNEACTVQIQRYYENEAFGFDTMRLSQVKYAHMPGSGPLAVDCLPNAMAVIPPGFNTTTELVSASTYSRAPEICQIFHRLMGTAKYNEAFFKYISKYAHGNADTDDWIQSLIDVSGDDTMREMALKWLKENGHPTVHYHGSYNAETKQYSLSLKQTGWEAHKLYPGPFRFGVEIELFGANGNKLIPADQKKHSSARFVDSKLGEVFLHDFKVAEETIVFGNISEEPLFASIARGWSFFGQTKNNNPNPDQLKKELLSQIKYDDDVVNKWLAWKMVKESEIVRLAKQFATAINTDNTDLTVDVDEQWLQLHADVLLNSELSTFARGAILDESAEAVNNDDVCFEYYAISNAITALFQGLWGKYNKEIIELYNVVNCEKSRSWPILNGYNDRVLKKHLIHIMREGLLKERIINSVEYDNQAIILKNNVNLFAIAKELFEADTATDKLMGYKLAMEIIATVYDINPTNTTEFELIESSSPKKNPTCVKFNQCISELCCNQVDKDSAVEFLKHAEKFFKSHQDALEMYVAVISAVDAPFSLSYIRRLLNSDFFELGSPAHARGFARSFSTLRHKALLSEDGLALVTEYIYKIALLNQSSVTAFLQLFGDITKFDAKRQAIFVKALQTVLAKFDPVAHVSVVNNIKRILAAVEAQ